MSTPDRPRSASFFGERGTPHGFTARAFTKAMGFDDTTSKDVRRHPPDVERVQPLQFSPPELAEAVKRGVWQAGGFPLEFPTISLGESTSGRPRCSFAISWRWTPRK